MRIATIPDKRILEQRARLEFHYPEDDIIVFVPFYENPKITESQAANYAEYDPLGRNSSLYAYTGAKSRKFKVELKYTLPHLQFFEMGIDRFMRVFKGSSSDDQKLLFTVNKNNPGNTLAGDAGLSLSQEVEKHYWALRAQSESPSTLKEESSVFSDVPAATGLSEKQLLDGMTGKERFDTLDTLLFFLAVFRTSVSNKATNPVYGPPLVRLNFGTMYQSIPCIVKNYNIGWEEAAGYDLETLTPRRITVSLQLQEVRVGNSAKYEQATYLSRDNVTGWESVIAGPHTIDPGNIR